MAKVYEHYGIPERKGALFGVEIEIEGEGLPKRISDFWNIVKDGSLRGDFPYNSAEYVFSTPLSINSCVFRLDEVEKALAKARVKMSQRCSTHIHVNISDLEEVELFNFLYLAVLAEPILMTLVKEERVGNRFCLRVKDADILLDGLAYIYKNGAGSLAGYWSGEWRYSAINLASIFKYGSVEFRMFHGSVDKTEIMNWLLLLQALRVASQKFDNPKDIYNTFLKLGAKEFFSQVFNRAWLDEMFTPELERSLNEYFSFTIMVPHSYTPRKVFGKPLTTRAKKGDEEALGRIIEQHQRLGIANLLDQYQAVVRDGLPPEDFE
jgi:Putative amidoligase enzyme